MSKMPVTKSKCENCRQSKVKCGPEDRMWKEDGSIQEKCNTCKKGNHPCGPGKLKRKAEVHLPQGIEGKRLPTAEGSRNNQPGNMPGMANGKDVVEISQDRINDKMKEVDEYLEIYKQLRFAIDPLTERQARLPSSHPYKEVDEGSHFLSLQISARENTMVALAELKHLTDSLADTEGRNKAIVENAYRRAKESYRALPFPTTSPYSKLLKTLALFYAQHGEDLQAEKQWMELSQLPGISDELRREAQAQLQQTHLRTTPALTYTFQRSLNASAVSPGFEMPFPPSHRLMRCEAASTHGGATETLHLGQCWDFTGSTPLQSAITGDSDSVANIILYSTEDELLAIDWYQRSPLLLAALSKKEAIGEAILSRFESSQATRHRLLNGRDAGGTSLLAIAIMSGCSFAFIRKLVEEGAEADPMLLMPHVNTPLQAAAICGRSDVVAMLLMNGAKNDSTFPKEATAAELALARGHLDIVYQLNGS